MAPVGRPQTRRSRNHADVAEESDTGSSNSSINRRSTSNLSTRSKRPASYPNSSNSKNDSVDDGRGGRSDADNGFAQWGGYMAAKKQKLDRQFNESGVVTDLVTRSNTSSLRKGPAKQIFTGDSIYINGYTYPPEPELRELFTRHGGRYVQYPDSSTTFVVATNLATAKKKMYAAKTLKPEWITDSIREGKKLDHRKYFLYDLNKENKQNTLTQTLKLPQKTEPTPPVSSNAPTPTSSAFNKFKLKDLVVKIVRIDKTSKRITNQTLSQSSPSPAERVAVYANNVETPTRSKSNSPRPANRESESSGIGESQSEVVNSLQDADAAPPSEDEPKSEAVVGSLASDCHRKITSKSDELRHESDSDDSDEVTILESTPSPPRSRASMDKTEQASLCPSAPTRGSSTISNSNSISTDMQSEVSSDVSARPGTGKMKTAREEGYLQEFYSNSRLHLISTLKKERQQNVGDWRANIHDHKFPLAEKWQRRTEDTSEAITTGHQLDGATLFHIDLNCFFVAVARLSRPHLKNKPMVITHSKGTVDSKSDIACASYEARDKGISAGMWLHQAKELCPDVVAVPYEFDEYSRVSKQFYETVAALTLEMEAISCDEMLVNVTKLLQPSSDGLSDFRDPIQLAQFLIDEIETATGIKASVGIGANRLLVRLATRVAKDTKSGCHFMKLDDALEYIRPRPVKKLPGIGRATAEKLEILGVTIGSDLERLSLHELKREFGDKTGQKLHSVCRGIDDDSVNVDCAKAKSISAGCSFGVRLANTMESDRFMKEVAEEAANRAKSARCYCNKMTLTLWIARKGYEKDTVKPGGHGIADVHTKSQTFKQKTRDASVLASSTLELARGILRAVVPPEHIRGVSISLDGLVYESDLSEKERKSHQPTLFSQIKKTQKAKPDPAQVAVTPLPSIEGSSSATTSKSTHAPGPSKSKTQKLDEDSSKLESNLKPASSRESESPLFNDIPSSSASDNPYADIQELDPSYLAALPNDVRAEVELEFQKARNQKGEGSTSEPGSCQASSSKASNTKTSPKRPFLKTSPLRGRRGGKNGSPQKSALKFYPRKQSGRTSSGSSGNLYNYLTSVARAKKSPSVSPIKRPAATELDSKNLNTKNKSSPLGGTKIRTSTQKPGRVDPPSLSLSTGENRLTDLVVPESPEPELDDELQLLLETSPTKKSPLEVEKMVLSFNDDSNSKGVTSGSNDNNSNSNKTGRSCIDNNECGQRILPSERRKSHTDNDKHDKSCVPAPADHLSPRPTTSTSANVSNRVRTDSGTDDVEIQAALLKSYGQTNGLGDGDKDGDDGYDFGAVAALLGSDDGPGPSTSLIPNNNDDDLSLANNLDSDRDDDFNEYDLNPTFGCDEMELPSLNGETEIDKVHETIRRGITDREPSEEDAECLMTYFRDLSSSFLAQTCNSLRFLQALRAELTKRGGPADNEWSSIFETIINQTQEWIQEDYGGSFDT